MRARRLAPAGAKYRDLERAVGQRIEAVGRRGKFLVLPLSGGDELIVHLGMTGVVAPADEEPDPVAASGGAAGPSRSGAPERDGAVEPHLRVTLALSGPPPAHLLFRDPRRFGRFLVVAAGCYEGLPTLAALGPEPLSEAFTPAGFHRALAGSSQAIKTYLLSQRPVAGVGNIYADEALWRARIHPRTPARLVSRAKAAALHGAIREVLRASLAAQGTTLQDYRTVNGEVGAYLAQLDAYGHAEEPCPRCGRPLRRTVVGQRGTVYCASCQRRRRARGGAAATEE